MALGDEKYMLFTTFRKDGTPVSTPVWVVALDDGKVGFWTSSESGKAKRLAHTARVEMTPSDARGRVRDGAQKLDGTAQVVQGPELEAIRQKVIAKYGWMTKLTKLLGMLRSRSTPYGDRGVIVTPSA